MSPQRVVVDGSNIATEGRSLPSLVQLDEAVRAYRDEHPDAEIIVVVDATFAHRIDDSERAMFEEAAAHNELVYPPAGAIGRGDAFLLRVADKTDAIVLSNDSFQEFHGEFEWLFEKGRLIGGTPVPGVGWIFVPRTPVRGPKSREAVKEAKRGKARIGSKEASQPMPVPTAPPPRSRGKATSKAEAAEVDDEGTVGSGRRGGRGGRSGARGRGSRTAEAIEEATQEAVAPGVDEPDDADGNGGESADGGGKGGRKRRRKRKGGGAPALLPTVNEPLTFIQFIADFQPGAEVEGEIESFASHGAFVLVGDARCYIPLSAMGDPPPRSAREMLNRGETRTFVVQALDAPRRGIELALPGFARVAGRPTDETVEAEIDELPDRPVPTEPSRRTRKTTGGPAAAEPAGTKLASKRASAAKKAASPAKKAAKAPAGKSAATKKTPAGKTPAKKTPAKVLAGNVPAKKAPTGKTAAKQTAAKQTAAKKPIATKAAAKKSPAKKSPAKKTATKKTPAKITPVSKVTPATKKEPTNKATPTSKAATTAKKKATTAKKKAPAAKRAPS